MMCQTAKLELDQQFADLSPLRVCFITSKPSPQTLYFIRFLPSKLYLGNYYVLNNY